MQRTSENPMNRSEEHAYLKSLIDYDPRTGRFTWRVNRQGGWAVAGDTAGGQDTNGYWRLYIDGKSYSGGKLAMFLMNGVWPEITITYRDGDPRNTRWTNLMAGRKASATSRTARYQRELYHLNRKAWERILADKELYATYMSSNAGARRAMAFMRAKLREERAQELGSALATDPDLMVVKPGKQTRRRRKRRTA